MGLSQTCQLMLSLSFAFVLIFLSLFTDSAFSCLAFQSTRTHFDFLANINLNMMSREMMLFCKDMSLKHCSLQAKENVSCSV